MRKILTIVVMFSLNSGELQAQTNCNSRLWSHVYYPGRFTIWKRCTSVTGVILNLKKEADGDYHIQLKLDPGQPKFLNQRNVDIQKGGLPGRIRANLILELDCQQVSNCNDAGLIIERQLIKHLSMTIDKIREQLAEKIAASIEWVNKLDNSEPGHYVVEDWEIYLLPEGIWVDIPRNTFTFKNAKFDFELLIGGSNDGVKMNFSRQARGNGIFKFSQKGNEVEIEEIEMEFNLDLFHE